MPKSKVPKAPENGDAGPSSPATAVPSAKSGSSPLAQVVPLPMSPPNDDAPAEATASGSGSGSGSGESNSLAAAAQILSPKAAAALSDAAVSPRSSMDQADRTERVAQLEQELGNVRQERDVLAGQYRGLLGKLTAMRQTLGEKLKSDAVSCAYRGTEGIG